MSRKRDNKRNIVIPNGSGEDEIGSSESEDETSKVAHALRDELNMSEQSSISECEESNSHESDSQESENEEKFKNNGQNPKKKKRIHWAKNHFVISAADFADNLPPPPINDELEPIDYFYFMFRKQSMTLLTNQSNLYSVQKDPNKPVCISETEMALFIDIATVLLKMSPPLPPPIKRGRSSLQLLQVKSNEKNSTITARTASSPAPSSSVRFDKFDHWPTPTSKGRCRIRGCTGYTRISCSKCELRLCLNNKNNCYTDYHS
ncbi:unnamed protein product [Rotaria socialis]|uniref:PiggyBac transposable element-derived protein domain-containing protein n=2 Tax=Rotaria socialis TaxID=392032 RepID=A0A820TU76_9BILA|nr:unnamed protein product [Rotaria socialis]